ncbi:uncharacterized protein LOC113796233 [Dermatophagoides pteronyssinus]|uniref:uncharacterized protein LOC113796233 n=1 Tax=Dermatophagoides pteronyssinus TaxID=6956 RepID=UPI003F671E14
MDNHLESSSSSTSKPITLYWKNLCYDVYEWQQTNDNRYCLNYPKRQPKSILNCLNGSVCLNSLNALLGPSGAGKTSFINCLTGNISINGKLSRDTEIYFNQKLCSPKSTRKQTPLFGLVPQFVQETIFGRFTVEEILKYSFCFKNPSYHHQNGHQFDHLDNCIRTTMNELMLDERIRRTRFEKCSGGEKRRIAIAQELMSDSDSRPMFLFIDEPTTGLDSESALLVIRCLQRLSKNNPITVFVSIHSPSQAILNHFDKLFILAKGGLMIYSGRPNSLPSYLKQVTGIEMNDDISPIEKYLSIASNGIDDDNVKQLANSVINDQYEYSLPMNDKQSMNYQSIPNGLPHYRKSFYFQDLFIQFKRLLRLLFIVDVRVFIGIIILQTIGAASFISIVDKDILDIDGCASSDVLMKNITCNDHLNEERLTSLFIILQTVFLISIIGISTGILAILSIGYLKVVRNEYLNGWYSFTVLMIPYHLVQLIKLSLLIVHLTVTIYLNVGYIYIDNYQFNWLRFGNFLLFYLIMSIYSHSFGQLSCSLFPENVHASILICQLIIIEVILLDCLLFITNIMKKSFVLMMTEWLGFRYIGAGLLYAFFGIDRCDYSSMQYSSTMDKFFVDIDNIYWNLLIPLANIIIIRFIGFIVTYFHLNPTLFHWKFEWKNILNINNKKIILQTKRKKLIPIIKSSSINTMVTIKMDDNNNNEDNDVVDDNNDESIKQMKQFCKDRYIIGWRNLTLYAKDSIYDIQPSPKSLSSNNDNDRQLILRNLDGQIKFGTLNALMGSSGSGKTSLLKVLNGHMKTKLAGSTQFYLSRFIPIRTCFIAQEISDHLIPGLTVRQSLIYASKLKNCQFINPTTIPDHNQRIMKLMYELDIMDTAETLVQNCSGGQRKRLALALELTSIQMPNLICIDEPTSGLDSNSSRLVLKCLRKFLSNNPQITMIVSIHQPNTEQLMMFDHCYVLAYDGICIYSGPPNQVKNFLQQESSLTNQSLLDELQFPIETLIKYSCTGLTNPIVQKFAEKTSKKIQKINISIDTIQISDGIPTVRNRFTFRSIWILFDRSAKLFQQHLWFKYLACLLLFFVAGLSLVGFIDPNVAQFDGCLSLMDDDINEICTNRTTIERQYEDMAMFSNVNYMIIMSVGFMILISPEMAFHFAIDLPHFMCQHANGWYSCGTYYIMKLIYDSIKIIPFILIYVYMIDIYSPVSMNNYFVWYILILHMGSMAFIAVINMAIFTFPRNLINIFIIIICFLCFDHLMWHTGPILQEMNFIVKFVEKFAILKHLHNANLWLVYGGERCSSMNNQIQIILYMTHIEDEWPQFLWNYLRAAINIVIYHCMAFLLFLYKSNELINRHERAQRIQRYRTERLKC